MKRPSLLRILVRELPSKRISASLSARRHGMEQHSRNSWLYQRSAASQYPRSHGVTRRSLSRAFQSPVAATTTSRGLKDYGATSIQGTSRKQNEDRYSIQVDKPSFSYLAVFDGHGGYATSDWLEKRLEDQIAGIWQDGNAATALITEAFLEADRKLLAPKGGFFGSFGERGVGGSKCGATGVVALLYSFKGKNKVLAANVGDSRALLIQNGKAAQLTIDHVPDMEEERLRIESQNPNPKAPLVRFVGGTWRVGGILALSRAFGDAFMKGSLQFEGPSTAGSDGYAAGFGVIAEPSVVEADIPGSGCWLILASDGLFANEIRGGGGGLSNEEVASYVQKNSSKSPETLAQDLAAAAQSVGSTDDVTVIVAKLA